MTPEEFDYIINSQLNVCRDTLIRKADEYAADTDRLHNFKIAAKLQGCEPGQALGGMMAKHTVSIYDMIFSGKTYPMELWGEKITDHINYLLLLMALLCEEDVTDTVTVEEEDLETALRHMFDTIFKDFIEKKDETDA